jgi:hypothetical protein
LPKITETEKSIDKKQPVLSKQILKEVKASKKNRALLKNTFLMAIPEFS